jgi:hypothetical protein
VSPCEADCLRRFIGQKLRHVTRKKFQRMERHPLRVRQGRLAVELLKGRKNDRFLSTQVPGLTGSRV